MLNVSRGQTRVAAAAWLLRLCLYEFAILPTFCGTALAILTGRHDFAGFNLLPRLPTCLFLFCRFIIKLVCRFSLEFYIQ
jgi:hypothetical protein